MESPAGGREAWVQEPHRSQPQNQSDLGPALVTSYMKRKLLKHFQHLRFPLDKCHGWTNWSGLLSVCPSLCCDTWSVQSTMHRVQSPLCSSAVCSTCCSLPSSPPLSVSYMPCMSMEAIMTKAPYSFSVMLGWEFRLQRNSHLQPSSLCCLPGVHLRQT